MKIFPFCLHKNADFKIALIAYCINHYSYRRQKFHFLKLYAPLQPK